MKIVVSIRQRWIVLGLGALALRLLYVALAGRNVVIQRGSDAPNYDEFARLMLKGWVWFHTPLAAREPLYPALMAFSYILPGSEIGTLQVVQALLGAVAVVVVYLGLRSIVRESVALLTAMCIALNPHFVIYTASPYRENLIIPLLAFFIVLFFPAMKKHSVKIFAACALVYALLVHTDVRFLPLSLALPFMVLAFHLSLKRAVVQSFWFFLFLFLFMVPYMIRGYVAFGRPIVVTERFLEVNLPMVKDRFSVAKEDAKVNKRLDWMREWEAKKEAEKDRFTPEERRYYQAGGRPAVKRFEVYWFLLKEYWRFARLQPAYRPYLDGRFAGRWSLQHNLASSLVVVPFFLFLPFVWFGFIREERRVAAVLFLFVLSHMALHVLVHARERYRFPAEIMMACLLAIGLVNAWTLLRRRLSGR